MPRWFSTETVARRASFLLTGRCDDREIIYIKRTAILGKTHVQQSFFAQKKTDGTLCSARYPGLPMAIPVQQAAPELRRIEKLYRLQPPKGPPQKVPSAEVCAFLRNPKSKGRQPAYTHRRLFFHPATKLLKRRVLPSHRNVTMSARKASFTCFSIAELRLCCTKTVIF